MAAKIGALIRVSTEEQSLDSQREAIGRWISQEGIDASRVSWYEDKISGTRIDREGLQRLEKDITAGRIRTVVVFHLDRISRNMLDGMTTVARWLEKGIRIIVLTPSFEVSGIMGKAMSTMLFMFAEMELEWRKRRQAEGIEAAKKRGVYRGRRPGSTKAKPARARQLRDRGLTLDEIGQTLGVSRMSVCRYLR